MQFDSRFNIGEKVWIIYHYGRGGMKPVELTVGKITIEHTDSKGREGEEIFDNYKPQEKYEEKYMCDETGIGSGTYYILGKSIFATEKECLSAIAQQERAK